MQTGRGHFRKSGFRLIGEVGMDLMVMEAFSEMWTALGVLKAPDSDGAELGQ